jgi:serine/threonine-protein kinase
MTQPPISPPPLAPEWPPPEAPRTSGGTHHPGDEVRRLLRRRLRLLAPLLVVALAFSLTRGHTARGEAEVSRLSLVLQLGVIGAILALAGPILSRLRMSLRQLRTLELVLFGLAAVTFAWLQCLTLYEATLVRSASPKHGPLVLRLALGASAARWALLVVAYGTLVPNTVRRCAAVTAGLALMPLMIAGGAALGQPFFWPAFAQMAAALAAAAALALFACGRLSRQSPQALESDMLGQYQLRRPLRAGGMGRVYLAEHVPLGRTCAVKVIVPAQASDPATRDRFEREARAMASLSHPNVVAVYDSGRTEDGTCYYVMEYLRGLSLEEVVAREGALPPARAVHVLRQVCDALREAHGLGLLHLDIKPSNVIACRRGGADLVKLVDFGLVQQADGGEADEGAPIGSPPYMSPEQAGGQGALDARSDLYSLGGVAYFLLVGHPPFVRENALQMLLAHACDPITPPSELRPEVPADVQEVVLRCLEKDPDRRYPDAHALAAALAGCACAGAWTAEEAAAWWARHDAGAATAHTAEPTVPLPA